MAVLDRRRFLAAASLATLAAGRPAWARTAPHGFTHGVASGEPTADSILLWTRHVGRSGPTRLQAEIAEDPGFSRIVAGGSVDALAERDHTAKLTVTGLQPGRWYHYRFAAPGGERSAVGRTRTLPDGPVDRFTLAAFSCSNYGFGFFNAYAHAAARDDIDLALHLGDYIYEYGRGHYPDPGDGIARRRIEPRGEALHLADYRHRFACYRTDPDLQELHRRLPVIAMWDDHESANDSYRDGAENHDPATEGDWQARKRAAVRAYREWMPVSEEDWASYRVGNLATLYRVEERLDARTRQVDLAAALKGGPTGLNMFRDGVWADPSHSLFGPRQEQWLSEAMRRAAGETIWQLLAQQVNVGYTMMPAQAVDWASPRPDARAAVQGAVEAARAGLPFNMDSWNGYPAARSRLLRSALDADADLIVLSGDSHNAWAFDLREAGVPAGVEFGGQSVTSPGFEADLPRARPGDLARALVDASDELRWADTARRGYMTVALTPDQARAEWLFMGTIARRSLALSGRHFAAVSRRARRLTA